MNVNLYIILKMRKIEILGKISWGLLVVSTLGVSDSLRKNDSQSYQSEVAVVDKLQTPLVIKPGNFIDQFITPFWKEAQKRREDRLLVNPSSSYSMDRELSERLNILLVGFGETHEPPMTEKASIGSLTIASFDMASSPISLDFISFTHDIRAPEIERHKSGNGNWDGNPIKIFRAYDDGGFTLLREVMQNATGLNIDYQLTFDDGSLKVLTDDVLEGVEVEVPVSFRVLPFYLEGKKYPEGGFTKGREKMGGLRVLQFIKTVPKAETNLYPKELEHNFRKHLFLEGLTAKLRQNATNPLFLWRTYQFLRNEASDGGIAADFQLQNLLLNNLGEVTRGIGGLFSDTEGADFPEIRRSIYIVDSAHGDGGVQWVNASQSPAVRRELARKFYPDGSFEVPINANPDAEDLVTGYWRSVREKIKALLK